jgi:hypothetical protein
MKDTRHKNARWNVGESPDWNGAHAAILMDIRDELQLLNSSVSSVRGCPTVLSALCAWGDFGRELRRKERLKRKRARERARG